MSNPLVSVLMTAYNRQQYIGEAIESVLVSTYKNFELIIVDDQSKDSTVAIAESYKLKDNRISIFVNAKNLGDYPNRNNAATYANGEYILYVDSDDMIYPNTIEYCVNNIEKYTNADFAMVYSVEKIPSPILLTPEESIKNHFFKKPFLVVGPGATFLKKSFFEKLGKYPTLYGPANDMYFNLKAANNGNVLLLPYIFFYYRRHEGQEINNQDSYLTNGYIYLKDALNELNLKLSEKEIAWVGKKNKRRFSVNMIKYFFKKFNITQTFIRIRRANFSFRDALIGIFHFN